jgi:predicted house-cleaning NTP pyrophosphatase (Maf/HAM1 superfamily)
MIPFTLPKDFDITSYKDGEPFDVTATIVIKDGEPMLKAVNDMEVAMMETEEEDEEEYEMDEEGLKSAAGGGMM